MNVMRDPDAILAAWLEEGPAALPEVTRRAIAVTTRSTRQTRRLMWAPWRTSPMTAFARLAIVAVAVAVAIGGAAYVLSPTNTVGPPPTTASPRPSATFTPPSAPTGAVDTSGWVAYTSNRYGFDISHPADWTQRPATADWTMAEDWANFLSSHAEGFRSPDFITYASAFAVDLPADQEAAQWIADFVRVSGNNCDRPEAPPSESVIVDGQPGQVVDSCEDSIAFVVIGDRMHVFAVWQGSQQSLMRAMLSTVHFRATGAKDSLDTSDWVAYTSNRYGFSISHPPAWTERPATGDWSMAADRVNFLTGNAEGFTSPDFAIHVSAFAVDIPADRSMEEWQTAYHVPSPIGCDVLESEPTTVDGRPAVISHTCGESTAFVFIGNRAFVFAVWQPNEGALLEAFLSTVRITSPDTPLTTPAPVRVGPLVAGTYVGRTLQVADIVAMMNDDDTLTPADRSDIVEALGIQDKTTWSVSIELTSERLTERQTVDGMSVVGSSGKHAFPNDHTLVYTETLRAADVVTEFELTVDGDSFRLHRTTPAHGTADEFVTRTIFESGPFELF